MKKFLAAAAIAALGTTATAQTYTPAPEVSQAPSFAQGAGFGAMGGAEMIVGGVVLLIFIGLLAGDDDDNATTTVFK